MSRLARALWIEIAEKYEKAFERMGRGSREPCGLKFPAAESSTEAQPGRGSREPCGLKSLQSIRPVLIPPSRLARALWIEMLFFQSCPQPGPGSRLARALWIEIDMDDTRAGASPVEARESLVD